MERLRDCAHESVRRGCGFAMFAIFLVGLGLSGTPLTALRAMGILVTLLAVLLVHAAWRAFDKPYDRREVWMMLDEPALPEDRRQAVVSGVMRETFLHYADHAAFVAAGCWMVLAAQSLL